MKKTFGAMIAQLRNDNNMTQAELAEKMGVTDKAVSKWERDLSFPDVSSIPKLAEIFGVSVDTLMQVKSSTNVKTSGGKTSQLIELIFNCVALAMGASVTALLVMNQIDTRSAVAILGIGLASLSLAQLSKNK